MNSSESEESGTYLTSNASKTTGIMENNVASNNSSINGPARDAEFGIINSTESGNQSTGILPKMNANTSFIESMPTQGNSSILQSSEISMNSTNESITGNESSALLHFCDDGIA